MSNSTRPRDPPPRPGPAGVNPAPARLMAVRIALAVAYPLLAHWASHRGGAPVAALALLDLALIVLLQPLAQRRGWAWALLVAVGLALWPLAATRVPLLLLLAPPPLFTGLLAWWFGRSLRAPREPVITRIVAALERGTPAQLAPELYRYTRRLTGAWAALLAGLALANTVLALVAVPDGVLAQLGHAPVLAVSQSTWSWFANLLDYGIVAGFFVAEYLLRQLWFPNRYRSFLDFLQRMGALGPGFWRQLFD
ncbi:ketosynthase [Lysobacter koreensis]|uniref:Ketosynthase n=1 Tax=Lysobacter koreensis TaxID=266122 RepID=A0ABW2YL20_9GAMM